MRKALWGVLALVLLAAACAGRRPAPPAGIAGQGRIQGTVWNGTSGPLQGATVSVSAPGFSGPWETLTNAQGQYLLEGLPVGPELKVVVKARGYRRQVIKRVVLPPAAAVTLSAMLCRGECAPMIYEPRPLIDLRQTSSGAVVEINPTTGEPEPHPR